MQPFGFTLESIMTETITLARTIWIAAPREQVWQTVTDPERLVRWFVPNLPFATMKRDDSGKLTIFLGEMGVDFLRMEVVDPLHKALLRSLPENLVTVVCTFEDQQDGTQVTVTVTGLDALPGDAREERLHLIGAGWEQALSNLKADVAHIDLPYPAAFVGPLFGHWRDTKTTIAVERSIWVKVSRERVWRALVDPKLIQQWFSPTTPWQLSALEVGGRFYVREANMAADMYVEIIEVLEPSHKLVTRCIPEPPDTVVKWKTYTLTDENGGTRLTLTYRGYEAEPDSSRWGHMEENLAGFGMMLQNTKAYLEDGSLPFPNGF
jgi:uncharacterized protein YndB with AHSA1/START domain